MSLDKIAEQINKKDLDLILAVNKNAIEIQTAVGDQNEEIITSLNKIKSVAEESQKVVEKTHKQTEEISKELFKMQVLFITGLLSLVLQIIQVFVKK